MNTAEEIRSMGRCALLIVVLLMSSPLGKAESLEVIPLQHRPAHLLLPPLRAVASEQARISASSNQLIVRASDKEIAQLRLLIEELDQPLTQFHITVRQNNKKADRAHDLQLTAQYRNENRNSSSNIKVGKTTLDGKPLPSNGASTTVRHSNSTLTSSVKNYSTLSRSNAEQKITALEGYPAHIETGKQIPFFNFNTEYGTVGQQYKAVMTGFYVTPVLSGASRVSLMISAQKQGLQKHSERDINTASYSSTINVKLGDWVDLGSALEHSRENEKSIGKRHRVGTGDEYHLQIKIEKSR